MLTFKVVVTTPQGVELPLLIEPRGVMTADADEDVAVARKALTRIVEREVAILGKTDESISFEMADHKRQIATLRVRINQEEGRLDAMYQDAGTMIPNMEAAAQSPRGVAYAPAHVAYAPAHVAYAPSYAAPPSPRYAEEEPAPRSNSKRAASPKSSRKQPLWNSSPKPIREASPLRRSESRGGEKTRGGSKRAESPQPQQAVYSVPSPREGSLPRYGRPNPAFFAPRQ